MKTFLEIKLLTLVTAELPCYVEFTMVVTLVEFIISDLDCFLKGLESFV